MPTTLTDKTDSVSQNDAPTTGRILQRTRPRKASRMPAPSSPSLPLDGMSRSMEAQLVKRYLECVTALLNIEWYIAVVEFCELNSCVQSLSCVFVVVNGRAK